MFKRKISKLRLKADLTFGQLNIDPINLRLFGYSRYLKKGVPYMRALLIYLPGPVIKDLEGEPIYQFSNQGMALAVPRALNELGYTVDIVSWDDMEFKPAAHYDLLVAHGGHNFEHIRSNLNKDCHIIYYSTGSYWKFHNQKEQERFDYFKERHGVELPQDRFIDYSEEPANAAADGIISLGNKDAQATYAKFNKVLGVLIASYPNPSPFKEKNFATARKRFLYFAGGGNIHKGLDLLLDIFPQLDAELYICTPLDEEFKEFYSAQLFDTANIYYKGVVGLRSPEFYELTNKCAYAILPSCSEGGPGSMAECMQQGLVPVITKECHLDVDDFGVLLKDFRVNYLKNEIVELMKAPIEDLKIRANKARQTALTRHTPEYFLESFKAAVQEILAEIPSKRTLG